MRYVDFIKKGSTIGICAPSAGVGRRIDDYNNAISVLKKHGYNIIETASVRKDSKRSASAKIRAKELDELVCNKKIDMIFCATGGDYMIEMLPYINFEHIKQNPKLIMGYSDPTTLLFPTTVNYDIMTLYGFNVLSLDSDNHKYQQVALEYIKGNLVKQNSFKKYIDFIESHSGKTDFDKDVKWVCKSEVNVTGRCIGGCIDAIDKLMGTPYCNVEGFIEKYKDDGIVWYFDNFALSSYQLYLTLTQMKYAGFFKYCKAVLIGRTAFAKEESGLTYTQAIDKALGKIIHISEMDIGHVNPQMVMINGAIINVRYKDNKGSISFKLK